jgi:hypothetical protein
MSLRAHGPHRAPPVLPGVLDLPYPRKGAVDSDSHRGVRPVQYPSLFDPRHTRTPHPPRSRTQSSRGMQHECFASCTNGCPTAQARTRRMDRHRERSR